MTVLNPSLLQEYGAQIKRCFPEAWLDHCETEDDFQQVIEVHLEKALDAPGVLTKEKVQSYAEVVRYFYPRNFLKAKIDDIWSIFTQVIFVEAAYNSLQLHTDKKSYSMLASLQWGRFNPTVIKGKVDPDLEPIELGVFKSSLINGLFEIRSNEEGVVRERLSYLIDKQNVPPTFFLKHNNFNVFSFQLFYRDSTTLFDRLDYIQELSFPRSYIRELAFSEIKKQNSDPSLTNILINNEGRILKLIDNSFAFPKDAFPHKISVLFVSHVFRQHLSGPFSDWELADINKISIEETCALLKNHQLDDGAIKTHRCTLLMLKQVIPFNGRFPNAISLEDLLVIVNLSDPLGFSYPTDIVVDGIKQQITHYIYGKGSLFSWILQEKDKSDEEICQKIDGIFSKLINLKSPGSQHPGTPNRGAIHDYYHKNKDIYFL